MTDDDISAVEVLGVTRRYGASLALDAVSLTVRKGEFLSLLGSSGSGKTTLLRVIGGFVTPTSGDVRLHGRSVLDEPPHLRRTNMIFQQLALFPHLNVRQNIAFGLELKKTPGAVISKKVDEMLGLIQLEGLHDRRIDQLSGGQRQRVAMARALVNDPEVLLLDEPLGALDLKLRIQMQDELRRIHKMLGSTFIFVTHDQGEAITMSDRVAVMSHGKILQIGTPREIYESPEHLFVADFMGHSNRLPGMVLESRDGMCMVQCGPQVLSARQKAALPKGTPVTVVVRFEKVDVSTAGAEVTALEGRVVDLLYMGPTLRVVIQPRGVDFLIRSDLPANDANLRLMGQTVHVSWPRDAAIAVVST